MKKLLILFFLLITMPSFCQNVPNVSTQELLDYSMDLGVRKVVKRIPEIQIPGQLPNRKFFGNLTTDTLVKASANLVLSSTNLINAFALKANLASPTFTGTVSGISKGMVGLGNVDNTSDLSKPLSTAAISAFALKANLVSPVFTGNVGIGISSTSSRLNVVSETNNIAYFRDNSTSSEVFITGSGTQSIFNFGNRPLQIQFNSSPHLTFDTGGNLGIGTTTPAYRLSVNGITNTNQLIVNNAVNNGNTFQVTGNSSFAGNVGIGTSSPVSKLNISSNYGTSEIFNLLQLTNLGTPNNGDIAGIGFSAGESTQYGVKGSIGFTRTATYGIGALTFYTNNSYTNQSVSSANERMRISADGKIGIGTTNPTSKLQVVGLPTYADNTTATNAGLTAGAFYRTSTGVLMVVF